MTVTVTPATTALWDNPIPEKMRSLRVPQGQCTVFQVTFLNDLGNPVDLTPYASSPYTAQGYFRESVQRIQGGFGSVSLGSIVGSATNGTIQLAMPGDIKDLPGIYVLEAVFTDDTLYPRAITTGEVVQSMGVVGSNYVITVLKTDQTTHSYSYPAGVSPSVGVNSVLSQGQQLVYDVCLVLANSFYLCLEPGLAGPGQSVKSGLPTLAEIRLHLRDWPEANRLLDNYEFDLSEIYAAAVRCVDYWNETPPPLPQKLDTTNFPFRYHWMEGIVYQLFLTAAHWFRRNHLPYTAAGVSVDDLNREQAYLSFAQEKKQVWQDFVQKTKVRANMMAGFGTLDSVLRLGRWGL